MSLLTKSSSPQRPTPGGFSAIAATLEVLGYLASIALASFLFVLGWLTADQAAVLTVLLLVSLIVLAWKRFDGGRHPCFFFLCLLTLFQAGRLLTYCAGGDEQMFRVMLMTSYPFDVSRDVAGTVLLAISFSAVCVYAPCRWGYRFYPPSGSGSFGRLLPYFYLLFILSLPVQLYKNYCYYAYARDHGGYLVFFIDHGGLAASVPLAVRAISLISLPAIVGIFVLEWRREHLRAVAAVYFMAAAPVLLMGSRGAIFSLILALWYLAKMKSAKRARVYSLGLAAASLAVVGALIGSHRIEHGEARPFAGPVQFIADQGNSLDVTEVAVLDRRRFAPHIVSYFASELQSAFIAGDQANYVAGKCFSDDVAMFLNPAAYQLGFGSGSAYVAEAYVAGRLWGVMLVSAGLGVLLHGMHRASRTPLGLFLAALILPDVLWMPRGGLLDWVSASVRVGISVLLLALGWCGYQALGRIGSVLARTERASSSEIPVFGPQSLPRRNS
jgi:O-antigen polysaccharide polymerase Wzy